VARFGIACSCSLAAACLALPSPARADLLQAAAGVPVDVPDQPSTLPPPPPSSALPDFAHSLTEIRLDGAMTNASSSSRSGQGTPIGLLYASAEAPVGSLSRFYVGGRVPLAVAATSGGGTKSVAGNLEGEVRLVFPLPISLAFGASLGVTVPTALFDRGTSAQEAAAAAASLDPTELSLFTPHGLAFRPAFDVRVLRGPVVLQLRDGADLLVDTTRESFGAAGRIVAHVGAMPISNLELSVEATQIYFFTNGDVFGIDVSDAKRTALTLGPFARLAFHEIDVGVGAITNLQAPLAARLDRFIALRLSIVAHPF
jgi:hypothetical protein